MKQKYLLLLIKVIAFVLTIYVLQRFVLKNTYPDSPVIPAVTPTATPIPTSGKSGGGGSTGSFAKASWYGGYFHGRRTASGKIFDKEANTMACANRFPLGTVIKLTYKGKTEIAECTDRGAFEELGRTFDLSEGLFSRLAPTSAGVILLNYELTNNNDEQRPLEYKEAFESCTRELYKLQRKGGDNL